VHAHNQLYTDAWPSLKFSSALIRRCFHGAESYSRSLRKSGALGTQDGRHCSLTAKTDAIFVYPVGCRVSLAEIIRVLSDDPSLWLLQFPSVVQHSGSLCFFSLRRLNSVRLRGRYSWATVIYCSHPRRHNGLKKIRTS